MAISVNTLIQWQDEQGRWEDEHGGQLIERVLWINECASHVFVIDIDPDNHQAWPALKACHDLEQALEAGTARRVREDPYSYLRQEDSAFNPKHLDRRNKAWRRIRSIVTAKHHGEIFNPHVLGPLVVKAEEKAARKAKKPLQIRKHLYIYLRHYWQGGQIKNALLPRYDRCGGKGKARPCPEGAPKRGRKRSEKKAQESIGINVDEKVEKQFLWVTKRFYEKGHKSVSEAYRQLCEHYYIRWDKENGKPKATLLKDRPSENQYRYWLSSKYLKHNWERSLIAREGIRQYNQKLRAVLGSSRTSLLGPGSMYYYDATIPDILLVSKSNRAHIIGRPIVHTVMDLFSEMIVGVSVVLQGPSWVGAMLAFENMTLDKVEFCKQYGIEITEEDWPSHHLPKVITGDRGELFSADADCLIDAYNLRISQTPPWRPDWKGLLERHFRILEDELISWLPGHIPQGPKREGEQYGLDACLTLDEFRQILISEIIKYNRSHSVNTSHFDAEMIEAGVEAYPCDVWQWGVAHRSGSLREEDQDNIRLNLLKKAEATVYRDGLHFDGARYQCDKALLNAWFVQGPGGKRNTLAVQAAAEQNRKGKERVQHVSIRHDPRTRDYIYLVLEGGKKLEVCTLIDPDKTRFQGQDWYDVDDYLAMEREAKQGRREFALEKRVETAAFQSAIAENAKRETAEALEGVSQAQRLKGRGDHRGENRDDDNQRHDWQPAGVPASLPKGPPALDLTTQRRLDLEDE